MLRILLAAGALAAVTPPTSRPVGPGNALPTTDANGAAFTSATGMAIGKSYPVGRSWMAICSESGNVAIVLANGSTLTLPLQGAADGLITILPFAVVSIAASGTTATCTYSNLS